MRWIGSVMAAALLLAAGEAPAESPATAQEARPVGVAVLSVAAEDAAETLVLRGRTMPNRSVELEAETTGRVISAPRRKGARVAEGDVLCRLDPGSRPAQLAEAEAALKEARAEADAAESLSAKGFTAETTRFARQAALQAAQAQVDLVRLDIARLEIRAPFDGWLETDTAELGERLGVGDPCVQVVDLSRLRASGYVGEQDVDRIALGQHVTLRLVNGREADGEVSFIARVADPDTRTYEVEVTLPNADGRLRAGMTAEMRIDLPPTRAHRIPQSALTLDDEGRLGVRLAEDGRAVFRPVSILRDETHGVWVTGLPDTARVIVAGQEFVRDGGRIEAREIGWDQLG